ncbi:MAG: phenylalanine--tRNA ligase subunit beta, partial [Lachnospiraceae bacterium]|nr:phenylalanine--tRNA ligase subunit beta [Lachnospiraceae bacterium]
EELGSSKEMYPNAPEDGIYILPAETPVGADAIEVLGLHDAVFEYEITSNRVDCYSVLGIAREAAATFRKEFLPPVIKETGNSEDIHDYLKVSVLDPVLCKRYCARMVKNIKLGPSPEWMQRRLAAAGIRPINNLVDITNYVMEEYGQPMHAFDYDQLAGHEIVVKCAEDGQKFVTLDGQERTMDSRVLMINDGEKAVGIAGIMGGENSKITDDVKTMVFEAACFDGTNIRLSSKRIGLRTDASGKFEKGLEPHNTLDAINRACALIEELGCGEVVGGIIDICEPLPERVRIPFKPDRINALLGTDLTKETMLSYFPALGIDYDSEKEEVISPYFRQDLFRVADIAEEVARFYGYDHIPTTLPSSGSSAGKISYSMKVREIAESIAEYCGFSQSMTYSFESPKVFDRLLIPENDDLRKCLTIANPLGEDYSIMRTTPLNGILNSLSTNFNRRNKDVALYEMAKIYLPVDYPEIKELPDERIQFTLGAYGNMDFFTMKGVVEEFFEKVGMKKKATYDPSNKRPFFHPGRCADIYYGEELVGYLGEIHPQVAENYSIGGRVYVAVLDMPKIEEFADFDRKYSGIAKFPSVSRDISVLCEHALPVGEIEKIIEKKAGKMMESYSLFDVYEGEQIKAGFKSVSYTITFRASDHTLEEKEVSDAMNRILEALKDRGITLREV